MDLKDKMKRTPQSTFEGTPFRQNSVDRNSFLRNNSSYPNKYSNRQVPRSVQYQTEQTQEDSIVEETNNNEETLVTNTNEAVNIPNPQNDYIPAQEVISFAEPKYPEQPVISDGFIPPMTMPPTEQQNTVPQSFIPQYSTIENSQGATEIPQYTIPTVEPIPNQTNNGDMYDFTPNNTLSPAVNIVKDKNAIKEAFITEVSKLFQRYDIEKVLIVENKIYTASFNDETDEEIFSETLDLGIINNFGESFVQNGYFDTNLDNNYKVEFLYSPISVVPTIIVSKCNFDYFIDEEFVSILFEFLNKKKNIVVLSSFMTETLFKAVSDYFDNSLCVTINEPIKTNNNIPFLENPEKPSLKTVFSITQKIEPDNILVYSPIDLFSTLNYMKKNNGTILFSDTETPSDFVNSDAFQTLGGNNEYNRISILKGIDIIFTVSRSKKGTVKYTATQLLSATNKSHVNKIKRIVGDSEIDINKIYLHNVFEKEV